MLEENTIRHAEIAPDDGAQHHLYLYAEILLDPNRTTTARTIAGVMLSYADEAGDGIRPGARALAQHVGCHTSTVYRNLRALREAGWLERTDSAVRMPGTYRVMVPSIT